MHSQTLLLIASAALLSLASAAITTDKASQFPNCAKNSCVSIVGFWSNCQAPYDTDPLCTCKNRHHIAQLANCVSTTCKLYGDPNPEGDIRKALEVSKKLCKADGITLDEEAWKAGIAWDPLAQDNKGKLFPYWDESNADEPLASAGATGTSPAATGTSTAGAAGATSSSGAGAVEVGLGMGALVMAAIGAAVL